MDGWINRGSDYPGQGERPCYPGQGERPCYPGQGQRPCYPPDGRPDCPPLVREVYPYGGAPPYSDYVDGRPVYPADDDRYPEEWHARHRWESSRDGYVPPEAVRAGQDRDGAPIFAGRAYHNGDLLPAKVTPAQRCAYVSWDGREIAKYEYEVMCSRHTAWEEDRDGNVPRHAVRVGRTEGGEHLYLGRAMHDGTMTPGKVQPSHGVLFIPYGGMEITYRHYEVLVNLC